MISFSEFHIVKVLTIEFGWHLQVQLDMVTVLLDLSSFFSQPPLLIPTWAWTARTLQLTCCLTHQAAIVKARWTTMGWTSVWSWTPRVVPLSPSPLLPLRSMRRRRGAVTSVRSVSLRVIVALAICLSLSGVFLHSVSHSEHVGVVCISLTLSILLCIFLSVCPWQFYSLFLSPFLSSFVSLPPFTGSLHPSSSLSPPPPIVLVMSCLHFDFPFAHRLVCLFTYLCIYLSACMPACMPGSPSAFTLNHVATLWRCLRQGWHWQTDSDRQQTSNALIFCLRSSWLLHNTNSDLKMLLFLLIIFNHRLKMLGSLLKMFDDRLPHSTLVNLPCAIFVSVYRKSALQRPPQQLHEWVVFSYYAPICQVSAHYMILLCVIKL